MLNEFKDKTLMEFGWCSMEFFWANEDKKHSEIYGCENIFDAK